MAEKRLKFQGTRRSTVLYAILASLAIACPLMAMMCFSLFVSFTILLLASPLFLILSPVVVPAAIVLGAAVVAFSFAVVMASAGILAFAWVYRSVIKEPSFKAAALDHVNGGSSMGTESGLEVKQPL